MSKSEILEEIAKLPFKERQDLYETLWSNEAREIEESLGPTDEEKAILDKEYEDLLKNPDSGTPWREVMDRLREKK